MRILLVDDNRPHSEWLARALERERYVVEFAYDGEEANHRLRSQTYDMVILELALPRMDGEEVLRRLRKRDDNVPVMILTESNSLDRRVGGLNSGADDYMSKPFALAELEARIRVLLRRSINHKNPVLRCGNLSFDTNTRIFSVGDGPLSLTPREHAVLESLLMKCGHTLTKHFLAKTLFTFENNVSANVVKIYVHRLRKKLESCDASIVSLRGRGYLLQHLGV